MVRMFGEKDRARYRYMVRMFGEKDRARCSKSKRCGRWLGCLERKTEQDIVRARDVADG